MYKIYLVSKCIWSCWSQEEEEGEEESQWKYAVVFLSLKVQMPLVVLTAVPRHFGGSSKPRGQVHRHQEAPPAIACQWTEPGASGQLTRGHIKATEK